MHTATQADQLPLALFHHLLTEEDVKETGSKVSRAHLFAQMPKALGDVISTYFSNVEIAEEEIDRAQKRHPAQGDLIWQAFKYLMPSELISPKTETLYCAHCREILDRVDEGASIQSAKPQ